MCLPGTVLMVARTANACRPRFIFLTCFSGRLVISMIFFYAYGILI